MATVNAHIAKEHYKTSIKSATNSIIADEPLTSGGGDLGFSPFELLAASLSACTSITLRMYADRKGWNLTDVDVQVIFDQDNEKNASRFSVSIRLSGDLTEEQKQRLLKIANSCPTHKALSEPIAIDTLLAV